MSNEAEDSGVDSFSNLLFRDDDDDDNDEDQDPAEVEVDNNVSSENGKMISTATAAMKEDFHYLKWNNSTLVIKQLPSQGLSFQLWPAATTLVTIFDNYRCNSAAVPITFSSVLSAVTSRPLRVLELGSGTGLVGIAAAVTLPAIVVVTDLPHVIPNLSSNIRANAELLDKSEGSVKAAALRWGEAEDFAAVGREFDVVIGSDVVYHDHLYEPLLQTLKFLLGGEKRVVFLMSHLRRWKKESAFFKKARKFFKIDVLSTDCPLKGCRVGVVVYSFVSKHLDAQN